jgi:hypothetical protein
VSEALTKEVSGQQDERFWIAMIAVLLQGATYAKELGFADFHLPELKAFLLSVLARMRTIRVDTNVDMTTDLNVSSAFGRFWGAMRAHHVLITDKVVLSKGKPPKGSVKVIGDTSRLQGVFVQLAKQSRILRISTSAIADWCRTAKISNFVFVDGLKKKFGATPMVGRLGSGVEDWAQPTESLLQIDLNTCPLDFIDL